MTICALEAARHEVVQTVATMVAADVFLNPKWAGKAHSAVPKVLSYLTSKIGMTLKDLQEISPKLASQIMEVTGSGSESSRKKVQQPPKAQPEVEEDGNKRRKTAPQPKMTRKRTRPADS